MKNEVAMPQKYVDLVGTVKKFRGGVFSRKKALPETEFSILDIRFSMAEIINMKTDERFAAFELLLKNDSMKKSMWSRPFKIPEIKTSELA